MARRILVARKQPRSQSSNANLLAKRVDSQIREWHLSDLARCLRIRNPEVNPVWRNASSAVSRGPRDSPNRREIPNDGRRYAFPQQSKRRQNDFRLDGSIVRDTRGYPNGKSTNKARGGATRPVISFRSVTEAVGMPTFSMMLWISPTD